MPTAMSKRIPKPMPRTRLLALVLCLACGVLAAPSAAAKRALFDAAHGEQAGNADWVVDDQRPTPQPPERGIRAKTPGTWWTGAISTWGVELVKRGYAVRTNSRPFTYGNAANTFDLSRFDVLIVPEPNRPFTHPEAAAILAFVRAGGGLVAVGDHARSDRDRDGWDSPRIWNALDPTRALGVHWAAAGEPVSNITQTSRNVSTAPDDPIVRGPAGVVRALAFHAGTTLSLDRAANPSVRGHVWMSGTPRHAERRVLAASARYGRGRVCFLGDSSVIDDGSANPGNRNIYDGWNEAGGSNGVWVLNATLWVTRGN